MRVITDKEVEVVTGGICEGLSIVECIDGSGAGVVNEVYEFFDAVLQPFNDAGGDLGIWLYNVTHGC